MATALRYTRATDVSNNHSLIHSGLLFFWQALSPKSDMFFSSTKITTFGTEALFIPDNGLSTCTKANLSSEIFDLDQIRSNWKIPVRLGSIFGGIESSEAVRFPPVFHPEYTVASSRLIDVYLEMAPSHK